MVRPVLRVRPVQRVRSARAGRPVASPRLAAGVLLGLAGIAACTGPAAPDAESEAEALAAIAEFNRQYLDAINSGDIDALADLTTEDHMMISSGGAPLTGKQALVDAMTGAFARFDFDESWTPQETVVSGDLAFQRGTFVVNTMPKAGGDPSSMSGNFLRIYRRQADGRWLMVRDNFNSATPR